MTKLREIYERVQCQRMNAGMISETYEAFLERRVYESSQRLAELERTVVEYAMMRRTPSEFPVRSVSDKED